MINDSFACFNNKQVRFAQAMMTLRLIKPAGASGIRHPITGNTEILIQKYETYKIINNVLQWIFEHLMDSEGKNRLQRMKDCGALQPADKSKEEIEQAGDIFVEIANYK